MDKPFTIILNNQGKAIVTMDNRVADDESVMIQRFIDDGYIVKNVSVDEYDEIHMNGNFNSF